MGEFKPTYAALPLRALGDDRLSRADIVTLGAVAAHDRFGKNRSGCFASYARLADMTGQCERALKRSLSRLGEFGYIRVEASPMDARRRVLFVEYTDADAAAMRGNGRSFVKRAALRLAPAPDEIGVTGDTESEAADLVENPPAPGKFGVTADTDRREFGVSPEKIVERNQRAPSRNIFCETEDKRLREARFGREGEASGGLRPPGEDAGEVRLWRATDDTLSPAEQAAVLRGIGEGVRPSGALLALQAALRERGAA